MNSRLALFIAASIFAAIFIYRGLCDVMTGHSGVPLPFQKHLVVKSIDVHKVQDSMHDNVTLLIDVGNRASKDYRYLSLDLSQVKEFSFETATLLYSDGNGSVANADLSKLRPGINLSDKLSAGVDICSK
ncbi:hypothetical protein RsTz2092_08280 [Deferribacterales bacterium RsTz2092]